MLVNFYLTRRYNPEDVRLQEVLICILPKYQGEKTKKKRWATYVTNMTEMRNAYKVSFQKVEGKMLFERPGSGTEENYLKDIKGIGRECVNWIQLAQDIFQ